MPEKKDMLQEVAMWLVIIGALNWGLSALNLNIVQILLPAFANWVYLVIGASALFVGAKKLGFLK